MDVQGTALFDSILHFTSANTTMNAESQLNKVLQISSIEIIKILQFLV